ncbi:MAG: YbaB/EbfC family nucleoid-associated protein [Candidatus Peribacteraceae bacterium]|jgi:DNA-binding protein YbaB
MTSLSQAKDLFRMQREAKRVKKELKKIQVEAEAQGVMVVVNGEQEVLSITIADDVPREKIASLITDALNRAMKKAQIVASEKMQGIMGEMGMPTEQGMRGMSQ